MAMRSNQLVFRFLKLVLAAAALTGVSAGCGGGDENPTDPGRVPTAAYLGAPTLGEAPLTVAFTDQSSGSPTSWSWDFGDGGTSTQQNPSHLFQTDGTFSVALTATNALGADTEAKADYITATAGSGPTPVLDRILPLGAGSGMTITLSGQHFGDGATKAGSVMFGTVPAGSIPSWRDDRIKVVVPMLEPTGVTQVQVTVVVGGRQSNPVTFYRQEENVIRLTHNAADNWQPCWANNTIIFYSSNVSGNFNIWYMDDDGGNPVQRTAFTEGQTVSPAIRAPNPNLYYRSSHDGDWNIYVSSGIGAEGPITNTPEKDFGVVRAPSLSPFVIALSRAEEHNGGTIWNIYGQGNSGLIQISDNHADFHPTFSPNGQRVAYMYKLGDWDPGQIMVVSVFGGASTVISGPAENCAYPTWNWVYDTIAYTRSVAGRRNIVMRNPDGTNEVQLTFSEFDIIDPCWSPDGKRLAYTSFFDGHYNLYVVDVSGILMVP